jgi:hypothetical protein
MGQVEIRLESLGISISGKSCCGNLSDATEQLFRMVREKGLDKTNPEEYAQAMKLYKDAQNCCDQAQKYYQGKNYTASIQQSAKRCALYKQLFELLLKMLGA